MHIHDLLMVDDVISILMNTKTGAAAGAHVHT